MHNPAICSTIDDGVMNEELLEAGGMKDIVTRDGVIDSGMVSLTRKLDLRDFQLRLGRRLLMWAIPSVAAGLALSLLASGFWQAVGIQAAAWGTVDGAVALFGRRAARRKGSSARSGPAAEAGPAVTARRLESSRFRRILWINTGLDLLYIAGGIAVSFTLGRGSPLALGHGVGIVLQGAFLLFFDLIHAQAVPPAPPLRPFHPFLDERHRSFRLGEGAPAAVVVHGFPGTPAEMMPLAEVLHAAGWSVHAPLLPGFGPEFPGLMEMSHDQWRQAVERVVEQLRHRHRPVLLAGYSLGAALSIAAARATRPDGLLLLAPFWSLGSPLQRAVGRILKPFLPQYLRLFAEADFGDPGLRSSVLEFFPEADPEDPEFQRELRELAVPLSVLGELARAGLRAHRDAPHIDVPVAVIQGNNDDLAKVELTRRLAGRFPRRPAVVELSAGHRLLEPGAPWWRALEGAVAAFAAGLSLQTGATRGMERQSAAAPGDHAR
jgi:carboxylesterase